MRIQANEGYMIKGVNPDLYDAEIVTLSNGVTLTAVDYINNMVYRGWEHYNGDGCIHVVTDDLEVNQLLLIMNLEDGEVIGYKPFVGILTTAMDESIPEGLPRCYTISTQITVVITDSNGNEISNSDTTTTIFSDSKGSDGTTSTSKTDSDTSTTTTTTTIISTTNTTWANWIQSNYTTTVVDDYTYFRSIAGNTNGASLTGTELMLIYNDDNAILVDSIPTTK